MKQFFAIVFAVLALAGCSPDPLKTVIPTDTDQWEIVLKDPIDQLTPENKALVLGYIFRTRVAAAITGSDPGPSGITFGEAIKLQEAWMAIRQAEEEAEKAARKKQAQEAEARAAALRSIVALSLTSKATKEGSFSGAVELQIAIKNNSDKQVRGVAATIRFIDVFDKEVGEETFTVREDINPGETYTHVERMYGGFGSNGFYTIRDLKEGRYTTRFTISDVATE